MGTPRIRNMVRLIKSKNKLTVIIFYFYGTSNE